jgi:hypothetical protein
MQLENDGVIRKKKNCYPNAFQPYAQQLVKTNFAEDSSELPQKGPPEATVFSKGFAPY